MTLVDVRAKPIEEILPTGLRSAGRVYEFDDLILATGFDAMTGTLVRIDIRGVGGATLAERWSEDRAPISGSPRSASRICS